ncbi:hypothetical protein EON65_29825 [archaeon]|nr:MAG: hypothetical protein EON65_29825 [archaeon]
MPSAVRGHASTTTETIASGTQRYKFFRRPIMPKVSVVPPGILLAPTAQGENNPLEPIVNPPEAVTRDAEIQTMYRESEAQTVPYAPEYVIPNGQSPELLLLQNLRYDDGLPLGEKEIAMIEYARAKQDMEVNLPPFTDEASLILRKKLMEQQEMREFKMREIEIDQARHERVKKIEMALAEREESNDFMTSQRLESIRLLRMEEREKVLQKIRNKRIKALRRIAYQRNAADPVLSEGTKKDIIDSYFDRGSEVYAPIKRAGKEVAADPTKFDVEKRTVPLDTINNIVSLEYTIPRHIVDESDGAVSPPIFSKTMPVGAGHRMRDSRNTIKAAEPRLTSAAQRSLRMTKRDVEEMHQILMQKKTSSASLTHIAAPTTTGSPPLSPGKHSAPASPSRRGGPPPPTGTLAAKKPKGRPPSPDLTRDRDLGATADDAKLRADHEFQLAVTLLQRLIRGRAVQNIMFEGKYRRRELISELKSADTADAKLRDATDEEILAMEKVHREERIRDTSLEAVAGVVSSNMLHLLAEEKVSMVFISVLYS